MRVNHSIVCAIKLMLHSLPLEIWSRNVHSSLLTVADTDICFKCQNQQFKVVCAATFFQKCKSYTLLLEMLFVPHCMEQNSIMQAYWDYAVGNYLNDPVHLKIWAIAACIRPK